MKTSITLAPGLEISRIITGMWQLADMERKGTSLDVDSTMHGMESYVNAGLTTFDMADHYGSSEILAGHFKKHNPLGHTIQLLTKWVPKPGKISRGDVRSALSTALQRMQVSSIDLMQFHAWHYPDPSWLDALFYLNELKDEGLIRHIGVTNFDAAHLRIALASGIPIVSNQVSYSVLDQRASGSMRKVCEQYGVKLLAYGTLAGGFLSEKWLGKIEPGSAELNTWSEMKYKRFIDAAGGWEGFQHLLNVIHHVAMKHDVSIANIASRYVLENPHVAAIIIGARLGQSDHSSGNKKLFDIQLQEEDITVIKQAQQQLNAIPGDCGDEYRKAPFLTASGDLSHHLHEIPKPFEVHETRNGNQQIFSGTVWEDLAGFCRAVKEGNRVYISGTTATHGAVLIGANDPTAQTHFIIDKIEGVLQSFGGSLADVVRTRIFVNNLDDWEPVARAHGERFKDIQPANTLVEAKLVGEGYLVEMEAEATLA